MLANTRLTRLISNQFNSIAGVRLASVSRTGTGVHAAKQGIENEAVNFQSFIKKPKRMANSKYEYVKQYELSDALLPGCWIVVRIDGKGFTK